MTDAERLLWARIRRKQLKDCQFCRQAIIGDYIADFYCPKGKLVVELDGGQHYDEAVMEKDKKRDSYMNGMGLRVLRCSDNEVLTNLNGVFESIFELLEIPLNPPLKKGEIKSPPFSKGD